MIKTGKVTDSDNLELVGVTIAESDSSGKYITPITKLFETNENGIFTGDFKPNSFYTVSFVGKKKYIINTANGVPNIIKLENDFTLPETVITATATKKSYFWLIPIGLLLLLLLKKRKK